MTPLAMKYLRERCLPRDGRTIVDGDGMIDLIGDVHCFEMSEVCEVAAVVWGLGGEVLKNTSFLPAPETWIEMKEPGRPRVAIYARANPDSTTDVYFVREDGCLHTCWENRQTGKAGFYGEAIGSEERQKWASLTLRTLWTWLAIINTPRLVGRREHPPHKRLQRELRAQPDSIELRPWTEIRLLLTPRLASGNAADPERLTGRKCLHFCRSHLRIQNGRLVVVRPHWRGDSALGVKQSDYRVIAPEMAHA